MASVSELTEDCDLTILDAVPEGLLDCDARDLHEILDGPTLIELDGEEGAPLFVSVLMHGNETSGFAAIKRVLRDYEGRPLPRPLMLMIGNIAAAKEGMRRLEGQPDFNRIWPGGVDWQDSAEARLMVRVHARVIERGAIAAIDLHNNTGRNPHYSVVCDFEPATLCLASMFAEAAVSFKGIPGTQTASFTGRLPAITAECGRPGVPANAEAAAHLIERALEMDEPCGAKVPRRSLDLYHTLGVVKVREGVSFTFGRDEAELRLDADLDRLNFHDTEARTVFGETSESMPVVMIDEDGADIAADFFEVSDGKLRLKCRAVPAMLTVDATIVRQDCLGYLMERVER